MKTPAFSVIVCSYRRPESLKKCINAIHNQNFKDYEIVCVGTTNDLKTIDCINSLQNFDARVKKVLVDRPSVTLAMNAGLNVSTAPFVCFTDDDTEAPSHWIQTLHDHFSKHPECGAAGGPDRLQLTNKKFSDPPHAKKVGVYSWTGKWHATHHCPIKEEYLPVSILKGVNMAFRHGLIKGFVIGNGLRGGFGPIVGHEQGIAAHIRQQGFELHFLRDAWVLHHCAPRQESELRNDHSSEFALNTTYNNAYCLWRYQNPALATVVQLRDLLVGSRHVPGLLRLLAVPGKAALAAKHFAPALSGARDGWLARTKDP